MFMGGCNVDIDTGKFLRCYGLTFSFLRFTEKTCQTMKFKIINGFHMKCSALNRAFLYQIEIGQAKVPPKISKNISPIFITPLLLYTMIIDQSSGSYHCACAGFHLSMELSFTCITTKITFESLFLSLNGTTMVTPE